MLKLSQSNLQLQMARMYDFQIELQVGKWRWWSCNLLLHKPNKCPNSFNMMHWRRLVYFVFLKIQVLAQSVFNAVLRFWFLDAVVTASKQGLGYVYYGVYDVLEWWFEGVWFWFTKMLVMRLNGLNGDLGEDARIWQSFGKVFDEFSP